MLNKELERKKKKMSTKILAKINDNLFDVPLMESRRPTHLVINTEFQSEANPQPKLEDQPTALKRTMNVAVNPNLDNRRKSINNVASNPNLNNRRMTINNISDLKSPMTAMSK